MNKDLKNFINAETQDEKWGYFFNLITLMEENDLEVINYFRETIKEFESVDKHYIYDFACSYINHFYNNELSQYLIDATNCKDVDYQISAYNACSIIGLKPNLQQLIDIIEHQTDILDLNWTLPIIGQFKDDAGINILKKYLNEEDTFIQETSSKALAEIGSELALNTLVDGLHRNINKKPWFITYSITKFNTKGINQLLALSTDKDPNIRYWSLKYIGPFLNEELKSYVEYIAKNDLAVTWWGAKVATAANTALKAYTRKLNSP